MHDGIRSHPGDQSPRVIAAALAAQYPGRYHALDAVRELIMATERWLDGVGEHLGVHAGEIMMLSMLTEHELSTPSQLAASLGRNASTVTAALDRLERAGLIRRQPHAVDRRKIEITVTEAGQQAQTWLFEASSAALDDIAPADLEVLSTGFRQLARAITVRTAALHGEPR